MPTVCEGLRVLDLTQGMAGDLATMVLADAGAEVVKIEPPEGDWARRQAAFIMWNRGKKSVVLDLKAAEGQRNLRRLAEGADVLVASWSPQTAKKLGADYAALKKANPGLVYCAITGFGPLTGYAHLKGYEGIVAAKTGRMHAFDGQITKDGPIYAAVPCGSFGAAMYALQGIMGALYVRGRTGQGQQVETSLLQGLTAYDWAWLVWQMEQRGTFKGFVRGSPTPQYYVARCGDGRWLQLANSMSHLVVNFVTGIDASEVLDDPRFAGLPNIPVGQDMEELYKIWHAKMQAKSLAEWQRVFMTEVDVGSEPFLTTEEGMDHPQALHNQNVIELHDPTVGKTRQLGPLIKFSKTPMAPQGPASSLGQHTKEVLAAPWGKREPPRPNPEGGRRVRPRYPLEGVTVLEFASWFAAPYGPCILADMGARVIKVEPPDGDPWRAAGPLGARTTQGKESISIDLRKPEGQALVHKLIAKADILMHNYRPGVPESLGIGYAKASEINPRLVYLYAGAYGSTGPSSHRPAFHPVPGAICGGALYQAGRGTPPPSEADLPYERIRQIASSLFRANEGNPDCTSAVAVATAMLMGLYARERTGLGQYLETTMLCSNFYANSDDAIQYQGKPPRLLPDEGLNGLHALYRFYRTRDGWVFLAAPMDQEWEALCDALKRRDLRSDPRFSAREARFQNDAALAVELERALAQRTAQEWETLLSGKDVGCCVANPKPMQEFSNTNPEMKRSGMWAEVEHLWFQKYWRYGPGVTFSDYPSRLEPVTWIGQHTQAILREIGVDDAAVQDLKARRIVNWKSEP